MAGAADCPAKREQTRPLLTFIIVRSNLDRLSSLPGSQAPSLEQTNGPKDHRVDSARRVFETGCAPMSALSSTGTRPLLK
ncbi:MAG: hypothetical protein A2644_02635 [Candidatus Zambryskibacteria bacterium RIFCSPHIGHO2_01_FULL_39_63]|nr:MAG: hypothetical protein A2644_02635 [Candidatus Zambryskibacteria bacterium RIFCSPHIGHO2_01_FULL_39_63]OHA94391.1 MAG: hypothetical protein A3B88_01680 [Candidatus Zambryskibacteria bacterium RIFCSPHIGHO2_02_FULL_39_19]OHA98797.1 MAG: hypothetical protein A3F20_00930 [Candidatus Zambryskibacteria bacterium RIFCSPHIGHO2_12_FULL_39_21]